MGIKGKSMIKQAITKNSLLLACCAITVAAGLAITELNTREARANSLRKVQSLALEAIIPKEQHDNVLLDDALAVSDTKLLQLKQSKTIHIARKDGKVTAFIIPTRAPSGYGGPIHSLVGVNIDGSIAGVRVIQHAETPGLGDKVEVKKSDWVFNFNGKSLSNPDRAKWGVKKDGGDFDQFTGATITPRAVVRSIVQALEYFEQNKSQLMAKADAELSELSDAGAP